MHALKRVLAMSTCILCLVSVIQEYLIISSICLPTVGEVYSIGRGTYGQLGLGESATSDAVRPAKVATLTQACTSVDASSSVSFAVTADGKVCSELFHWLATVLII